MIKYKQRDILEYIKGVYEKFFIEVLADFLFFIIVKYVIHVPVGSLVDNSWVLCTSLSDPLDGWVVLQHL
jgi:hypothetical protein